MGGADRQSSDPGGGRGGRGGSGGGDVMGDGRLGEHGFSRPHNGLFLTLLLSAKQYINIIFFVY